MKTTINCKNIFGENAFCLKNRVSVETLEIGAKLYGGATQIDNNIFSNCDETTTFDINDENTLGIIVPSTIDVDTEIDNTEYVEKVLETMKFEGFSNIVVKDCRGSWYSDDLNKVVVENNTLITFTSFDTNYDINIVRQIAHALKVYMSQEAVSIIVNDSLAII